MSVQAAMKFVGEIDGKQVYWAEPGRFDKPGIYYWDGTKNVHVELTAPSPGEGVSEGWALVPLVGTEVCSSHPITCLNPDPTFEVIAVEVDSMGARARGENTCWFGVSLLAGAPAKGADRG